MATKKKTAEKKTAGAKKSPLERQKEEYGTKEKLVDKVMGVIGSITKQDGDKDELKARFLAASNKKLLHLLEIGGEIKDKFGSVEKLADATAKALGRVKDAPYVEKLKGMTPSRLLDIFRAAEKRGKRSNKSKAA